METLPAMVMNMVTTDHGWDVAGVMEWDRAE